MSPTEETSRAISADALRETASDLERTLRDLTTHNTFVQSAFGTDARMAKAREMLNKPLADLAAAVQEFRISANSLLQSPTLEAPQTTRFPIVGQVLQSAEFAYAVSVQGWGTVITGQKRLPGQLRDQRASKAIDLGRANRNYAVVDLWSENHDSGFGVKLIEVDSNCIVKQGTEELRLSGSGGYANEHGTGLYIGEVLVVGMVRES